MHACIAALLRVVDVSVCVPTYNSAKTLRICLDSIFRQTVKPKEVLVCDGGSTDKTLEILKKYPVKIVATNVRGVGCLQNTKWLASHPNSTNLTIVKSDVQDYNQLFNNAKATRLLGWRLTIPWKEGIRRTYNWVTENIS